MLKKKLRKLDPDIVADAIDYILDGAQTRTCLALDKACPGDPRYVVLYRDWTKKKAGGAFPHWWDKLASAQNKARRIRALRDFHQAIIDARDVHPNVRLKLLLKKIKKQVKEIEAILA